MMGRNREILIVLLNVIMMMMVFGGGGANFQMFQMVQQWPPAYCATFPNDCNTALAQATTRFTIHGYWPSLDNGDLVTHCTTHQLTLEEVIISTTNFVTLSFLVSLLVVSNFLET